MKRALTYVLSLLAAIAVAGSLYAHHAVSAVYDTSKEATFEVVITTVEWLNPHAHFTADVETDGKVASWEFELGSPNGLMKHGWQRHTLKVGDRVTVHALRARDGSRRGSVKSVDWPNGAHWSNYDLFDR